MSRMIRMIRMIQTQNLQTYKRHLYRCSNPPSHHRIRRKSMLQLQYPGDRRYRHKHPYRTKISQRQQHLMIRMSRNRNRNRNRNHEHRFALVMMVMVLLSSSSSSSLGLKCSTQLRSQSHLLVQNCSAHQESHMVPCTPQASICRLHRVSSWAQLQW